MRTEGTERSPASPSPGYEVADASVRIVGLAAAVVGAGIAGSLALALWLYHAQNGHSASVEPRETSFTHGPEQQTNISIDRAASQAEGKAHLETYGWVDRPSGVVRLPIERAISLVAAEAADSAQKGPPSP